MLRTMLEFIGGKQPKVRFIPQSEAAECALACLAMVASAHGYDVDIITLRQAFPISLKGANLKQIISFSEQIGLNAHPIKATIPDLSDISLPAILHWDLKHYVVLAGVINFGKSKKYIIYDPNVGIQKLSEEDLSQRWTGIVLELIRSDNFSQKNERKKIEISHLWTSISGFWQTIIQLVILSGILQLASLAAPFYLQIAVDSALPAADRQLIAVLGIAFGGLAVIEFAANWLRSITIVNLSNNLSYHLVVNLYRHLLRLAPSWFDKRHVGDIISRFNSTQPVSQLLANGIVSSFIDGVTVALALTLMAIYSISLTLISMTALLCYMLLRLSYFRLLKLRNISSISANAAEQSVFIENIRGISTIKTSGQEANRQRIWQAKKISANNASIKLGYMNSSFDASSQFVIAIERVIFVYIAVKMSIAGQFTIGMIFAFQGYKQQFLEAGVRLIGQAMSLRMLNLHLTRIADIALSPPEDGGKLLLSPGEEIKGDVVVQNASFAYGAGESPILSNVSMVIASGSMTTFIGPSGGGKSTLLKLLMGSIDPTYGSVSIDGIGLKAMNMRDFRGRIGVINQHDTLFAGSLAQNISLFDPHPDFSRIRDVSIMAKIHDEIEAMPLRYHTLVGDMGSALSGGQKQRVMLARALYNNPSMLFIDEGTANLDPVVEKDVLDVIASLKITRLIVAHKSLFATASDAVYIVKNRSVQKIAVEAKRSVLVSDTSS